MLLIGISMVKNEADIIEAFVRHNMQFLDLLYVLDHSSFDGTREILSQLIKEGYPIVISDSSRLGYYQSEEMTKLCRRAFDELSPDVVVPLDADEFLSCKNREALEHSLSIMPRQSHMLVPWRTYVPTENDSPEEINPVVRMTYRRDREPNQYFKVLVSRYFAENADQVIAQGSHIVSDGKGNIQHFPAEDIYLAHYPVRSSDQITSKIMAGWISYILAGHRDPGPAGIGYHWYDLYNKIMSSGKLSFADVCDVGLNYASIEAKGHIPSIIQDPLIPDSEMKLRYCSLGTYDPLLLAGKLAHQIAIYYLDTAEENSVQTNVIENETPVRDIIIDMSEKTSVQADCSGAIARENLITSMWNFAAGKIRGLIRIARSVLPVQRGPSSNVLAERMLADDRNLVQNSGLFDGDWYFWGRPDEASECLDPLNHYFTCGAAEKRDPSPLFDTEAYTDMFIDDPDAQQNPLLHYLKQNKSAVPAVYRTYEELNDYQQQYFGTIATQVYHNRIRSKKKNLVLLRCGSGSLHEKWLRDDARTWDLLSSCYDKKFVQNNFADVSVFQNGTKFTSTLLLYEQYPELFDAYDYILLLDDDIVPRFEDIDKLFAFCRENQLDLAQAGLTPDSYGTWPNLFARKGSILRHVNSVEVMMPVFSAEAFQKCIGYFRESISGWGLDLLWSKILNYGLNKNIAVVDAISFHHTKAINEKTGALYCHLRQMGINPKIEMNVILKKHQIPFEALPLGGVCNTPEGLS